MTIKWCSGCKEEKSVEQFSKCLMRTDGLQNSCKECHNSYNRAWQQKNKDKRNKQNQKWRKDNPELIRGYQTKVRLRYKEEWLEFVRLTKALVCKKCGYSRCFAVLDFHHLRDKEFVISAMMQ